MKSLLESAHTHLARTAVVSEGQPYTYQQLLARSANIAGMLLDGRADLAEARVAFLVPPGFDYVSILWGIWRAGGIAVPLCVSHPLPAIQYVVDDTQAEMITYASEFAELLAPLRASTAARFLPSANFVVTSNTLPVIDLVHRRALILYTSGTTGQPKGVVTTHQQLEAQITSLTTSWAWHQDDHILNVLPLHHVHGLVNVLLCALWSGACCTFLPRFDPAAVFAIFRQGEVNVFMAVPTIYFKLIAYWNEQPPAAQAAISQALKDFRLMVSGSAALPVSVLEKWRQVSGHTLLERYGMTEMGMAISNPYHGPRRPGCIGLPLNQVQVRLVDEDGQLVAAGMPGEIQVLGPNVFREYWQKPAATAAAFTADGWFKTGDIAVFEGGSYRILGRNSVDIIKSGGYKISALEIEEVLRTHPQIKECAVVGIPDEEWGEIIGASLVLAGETLDLEQLKSWLQTQLPPYKVPRKYLVQEDLPRNAMGKVTKQELKQLLAAD